MAKTKKLQEAEEALLDFVIRVSKGGDDITYAETQVLPAVAKVAFEIRAFSID